MKMVKDKLRNQIEIEAGKKALVICSFSEKLSHILHSQMQKVDFSISLNSQIKGLIIKGNNKNFIEKLLVHINC